MAVTRVVLPLLTGFALCVLLASARFARPLTTELQLSRPLPAADSPTLVVAQPPSPVGIAPRTRSLSTTTRPTLEPPQGIDLARAARAMLTRGCTGGRASVDGVACRADGIEEILSAPEATRFDERYRNPCTKQGWCVPYFYILGSFHGGCRDLYDRLVDAAPHALFLPRARRDGAWPYFFSETHMWERMLWRGCDFGACPRRRGVGAEPLHLQTELPELVSDPDAIDGSGRKKHRRIGPDGVFGEVAGGALTFTWSSAHSVLHFAYARHGHVSSLVSQASSIIK